MKMHPDYNNLLQFDSLNKESAVEHFFTTRKGGVSKVAFSSLNLGNYSDDSPMAIYENRQILARMWYMEISDFIIPHQTHGSEVLVIDEAFINLSPYDKIEALYGIDATITHLKDIFLCATTADCVPILLYDKSKQIVAAIHAGWKGLVDGIIENVIIKMNNLYQTNPSDIIAVIGPSISLKYYEIGEEVASKFKMMNIDLTTTSLFNAETNKLHIDLKQIAINKLLNQGIPSKQIEKSNLCTYANTDLFFSARRQSSNCGRMLSGIKLVD